MSSQQPNIQDWHSMDADQIPVWIMALLSPNEEMRFRAGGHLQQIVRHYIEDISEYEEALSTDALVLAVPFLVELLTLPQANKWIVLEILEIMARYYHGEELKGIYGQRATRIYQYLYTQFELYVPFIYDDDEAIRIKAAYLLGKFDEKSLFLIDLLLTRFENGQEPDAFARVCMAEIVLKKLKKHQGLEFLDRFQTLLTSWLSSEAEIFDVRAAAAEYLISLGVLDQKAVEILFESLLPNHDHFDAYRYIKLLLQLDEALILDGFLHVLENQDEMYMVWDIVIALLSIAFLDRKYDAIHVSVWENHVYVHSAPAVTINTPLTVTQKQILSALVKKDMLWTFEPHLFEALSLPNSQSALKQFIDG